MIIKIPLARYFSSEWSRAYRQFFLRADIFQGNVVLAVWQIANLAFAYSDFSLFGSSPRFYQLLTARVALVIFSALVILINRRLTSPRLYDSVWFVYGLTLAIWLFYINLSRPSNYTGYIAIDLVIMVTFYLLVPMNVVFRALPGFLITAQDLLILQIFRVGISPLTVQATWTAFVFANIMGIVFAIRSELYRYRQFQAQRELEWLAATDSLTGIFNRRKFFESADQEFARIRRYGESLALLLLDVDEFKDINDEFGHPTGDVVLHELVGQLAKHKRRPDVFGRIGGEEFALLMPATNLESARALGERFRELGEELRIEVGSKVIRVTVSIGVTEALSTDESFDQLMHRADAALYAAKNKGRNRLESG